jgi:hypothetical protein
LGEKFGRVNIRIVFPTPCSVYLFSFPANTSFSFCYSWGAMKYTLLVFKSQVGPLFDPLTINCKLSLCLTNWALRHEGVWGSGCTDPHFFDLGTSWRWVVSFTPRQFYPRGKNPRYPLDRRMGGPQCRSGRRGEAKILDPTGTRTPTPRSSSP